MITHRQTVQTYVAGSLRRMRAADITPRIFREIEVPRNRLAVAGSPRSYICQFGSERKHNAQPS